MGLSFEDLHNGKLEVIPKKSGVYWILMPENYELQINSTTDGHETWKEKDMIYSVEDLKRKAEHYSLPERGGNILYIGKAKNLYNRIKQYMRWGYYKKEPIKSSPHVGGRAIWQLSNNKKLIVKYIENFCPEKEETFLLDEYIAKYGKLPFANRKRGTKI